MLPCPKRAEGEPGARARLHGGTSSKKRNPPCQRFWRVGSREHLRFQVISAHSSPRTQDERTYSYQGTLKLSRRRLRKLVMLHPKQLNDNIRPTVRLASPKLEWGTPQVGNYAMASFAVRWETGFCGVCKSHPTIFMCLMCSTPFLRAMVVERTKFTRRFGTNTVI